MKAKICIDIRTVSEDVGSVQKFINGNLKKRENKMENIETAIAIKDDQKVLAQSNDLVTQANALVIKNDLGLHQAVGMEETLKAFINGPGAYHDAEIAMAHDLHKLLCAKKNAIVKTVEIAWKSLKDRRAAYQAEQQRKQEEAQRRAEEEARRIEAEKQAKIQAKIDEENARLAKIKNEEDRKKQEEKIAALQEKKEAVYVPTKIVAPVSTPQGASVSFVWDAKVIDKKRVPMAYLVVDIAMLEKMQKAAKGAMNVPGVEFVKRAVGSLRR